VQILSKLLAAGATLKDCSGDALVAAARGRHSDTVQLLLSHQADPRATAHSAEKEAVMHVLANIQDMNDFEVSSATGRFSRHARVLAGRMCAYAVALK
jgi:hypothetical protein